MEQVHVGKAVGMDEHLGYSGADQHLFLLLHVVQHLLDLEKREETGEYVQAISLRLILKYGYEKWVRTTLEGLINSKNIT